jgi:uncharacterized protein GlcG (DUF336 family)
MSSKRQTYKRRRQLFLEQLERREVFASASLHNSIFPQDVDADNQLSPLDALVVINYLNGESSAPRSSGEGESSFFPDVDNDGSVSPLDALGVINTLNEESSSAAISIAPAMAGGPVLSESDVETFLNRAAMATTSQDAIIAVVDRAGRILGVRVEQDVINTFAGRPDDLVFAIDGAVSKARTAAFFSNGQAPLTSRTVRFISQSTITQREVESNPNIMNPESPRRGPGFVAPIGTGGHFPPMVANTPLVDLLMIEHQSRDGSKLPGLDGIKGTGDDLAMTSRFNVDLNHVPMDAKAYMQTFPDSYGTQSGMLPSAQNRGIATLPGGIPIYKLDNATRLPDLVGGIGVFFPGKDGFATFEQGFLHKDSPERNGVPQKELDRTNAAKVLESEFIAFFATGGTTVGGGATNVNEFEGTAPAVPAGFIGLSGRIDLVGITLEIYGPHPTRFNTATGQEQLRQLGRRNGGGQGVNSGANVRVLPSGETLLAGMRVPEGWLVTPHASSLPGGLSAQDVEQIIKTAEQQAKITRAAIRLNLETGKAGVPTGMVLSVADATGEVLGLFRMPDATIFSIDVAVAKSRNTVYYAGDTIVDADRIDANNDGNPDVPKGVAFTNRTFRFLAAPRFPTGSNAAPGDFSLLTMPGINPMTAENADINNPLRASIYSDPATATVVSFDSFNASRNFRNPNNLKNQNGVVFFPGSSALYKSSTILVGGFGVSGDGVDQDDVVTVAGQVGFEPLAANQADAFFAAGVRLPYQKYNRSPRL